MALDWLNPDPHQAVYWQQIAAALASRRIAAPAAPAGGTYARAVFVAQLVDALRQSVDSAAWRRADHATLTWRDVCETADLDVDLPTDGWPIANAATLLAGLARAIPMLRYRDGSVTAGSGGWAESPELAPNAIYNDPGGGTLAAAFNDMHTSLQWFTPTKSSSAVRSVVASRDGGNALQVWDPFICGVIEIVAPCSWATPASASLLAASLFPGSVFDPWGTAFSEGWNAIATPGTVRSQVAAAVGAAPTAPDGSGPGIGDGTQTLGFTISRVVYDYGPALVWAQA